MKFTPLPLVLFVALFALVPASVRAVDYDVYLLAGQSNMDGRGHASELTPEQRQPFDDAIIFYRNSLKASNGWQPLGPGFSVAPKYKGDLPSPTFGPELGFAREMLKLNPNRKLALIKGSKGGTSLRKDWNPGVPGDPESQGPRYRDFIETIRRATGELEQRGDQYRIRGLLWHQGESDSKSAADTYRERLLQFVERIRQDTGLPNLPVVVGEVYDNEHRDNVRTALRAVGTSGPGFGFVSSEGTSTWDQGTHFDAASQLVLGRRYAEAIRDVQTRGTQPRTTVVCFGDSITKRGYPDVLGKLLSVNAINAGVGGNTTSKAMRRLEKDVLAHNPNVVVVFFGTNDSRVDNAKVHVPVTKYQENLNAIIQACNEIGAKVVLCTLPPINPEPYFTRHDRELFQKAGGLPALLASYRNAARQVASACDVPLVDLNSLLLREPEWMSPDGVHPSEAGNAIIAKHIATAVSTLMTP